MVMAVMCFLTNFHHVVRNLLLKICIEFLSFKKNIIWLNIPMDKQHLSNITKLKGKKKHTHTLWTVVNIVKPK
jgi:hypothetical protein